MTATLSSTLDRIPDAIVRAVSKRDLDPWCAEECICGWAVREVAARKIWNRVLRRDAEDIVVDPYDVFPKTVDIFGGTEDEWQAVYTGIMSNRGAVMTAWNQRVTQAFARAG